MISSWQKRTNTWVATMKRQELVREAVGLIKKAAGYKYEAWEAFEAAGWKRMETGIHKTGFRKGNVVAKIGETETDREAIKNIRRAGLQRHYARTYYISSIGVVQRAIPSYWKQSERDRDRLDAEASKLSEIAYKLGYYLVDMHCSNIGSLGGALKVFDCFCNKVPMEPRTTIPCHCSHCKRIRGEL